MRGPVRKSGCGRPFNGIVRAMIERTSTHQNTQWKTAPKKLVLGYTRAISETLSQMPLNNKHAFERTPAITFQISRLRAGAWAVLGAKASSSIRRDEWWLSRPNNSLEGTSREPSRKVGEAACATPLNFNRYASC